MNRLLYVCGYDLGAQSGTTDHALGLTSGLAGLGWAVTLVGPYGGRQRAEVLSTYAPIDTQPVSASRLCAPLNLAAKVRSVLVKHNYDVAYVRHARKTVLAVEVLKRSGIPYVVEVNTNTVSESRSLGASDLQIALTAMIESVQFANTDGLFCMTEELAGYARAIAPIGTPTWITGNGFSENGTQLVTFDKQVRESLGIPPEHIVLTFLGSLQPWQGLDYVIELLQHFTDIWLLVIGDGPEHHNLVALAECMGVSDRVRWMGWLAMEAVNRVLAAADIGVGSLALKRKGMQEAQPLKVRHYLGCGLPTIIGYHDTLLTESSPGVFHVDGKGQLLERLVWLQRHIATLRDSKLRCRIRAFALDHLSWAAIANETSDILRSSVLAVDDDYRTPTG